MAMANEYPKAIKRQLNRLAGEAQKRELARELTQLAVKFDEWLAEKISAGELHDLIHQYHHGPYRELFNFYNGGGPSFPVARAVAEGVLTEDEIPADVWPYIEAMVRYCRGE
jgi:HEPN domain-containing protein